MNSQSLFTNYIIAGVEASLVRVRAVEYVLPEADRQQAWHLLSFALKVNEAWPVTRELLLALAPKMELAGFREEWIPYLEKGKNYAQEIGDIRSVAECELQIGILYRLMSQFEEAASWKTKSVEHFARQKDRYGQARALNELAWLEQVRHHYNDAAQHVENAIEWLAHNDIEMAIVYRVKGMIASGQQQWQDAEKMHRNALKLFHHHNDQRRVAWSLVNIGIALVEQGKLEKAIAYYRRAAKILEEINDIHNLARVQMNLGVAYYRLGQPDRSLTYCEKSNNLFAKFNDVLSRANLHTNLGLCHKELHHYELATQDFLRAADLYTQLNDYTWKANAMDGLGMTYMAMQEYNKAIQIFEQALAVLQNAKKNPYYERFRTSIATHLQETHHQMEISRSTEMCT